MIDLKKKTKIIETLMFCVIFVSLLIFIIIDFQNIYDKFKMVFIEKNGTIRILKGLLNTFIIATSGLIIGLIIGTIINIITFSKSNNTLIIILRKICAYYLSIFRGTPLMVQLLIIYFIIFASVRGHELTIAVIAYGLNSGAYVAEILRGGINAVPKGQVEAGLSLGLNYRQTMNKIIIPQAIRNAFPSIGNEFISLIKETSIVGFIGAIELTKVFKEIATATFQYSIAYLIMGIIYFLIVLIISKLFKLFEMRVFSYD